MLTGVDRSAVTVDWELPTLGYIRNGTSDQLTDSDHTNLNVYRLPEANKVSKKSHLEIEPVY